MCLISLYETVVGILCGECVNGTAVGVLRTNCRECRTNNYYSIALLGKQTNLSTNCRLPYLLKLHSHFLSNIVIADLLVLGVIFFTIMKLDFHFPHSLKGLLFYIQTVYYVTESFPASFWNVRQYVSL